MTTQKQFVYERDGKKIVYVLQSREHVGILNVARETPKFIVVNFGDGDERSRYSKADGYANPEYEGQSKWSRERLITREEYVERFNNDIDRRVSAAASSRDEAQKIVDEKAAEIARLEKGKLTS